MPKLIKSVPKYRKHKATGQAVVTLDGRDIYLGPWKTKASLAEYDRLIGEWILGGRTLRRLDTSGLTVVELIAAYLSYARKYYPPKSVEPDRIVEAIRLVKQLYGRTLASEFGAKSLKAVRQTMIDQGLGRKLINGRVGKIKRMFKWGASDNLVPVDVYQSLATVEGLRVGYTSAKESEPVRPVPDAAVEATLRRLSATVADMVRLQRLTGARPTEICTIRPRDFDRSGDVWVYRPSDHKTAHLGKRREICIGPKGQAVLLPYLLRAADAYCFSPAESEEKRRAERSERRRVQLPYGNRRGSNRKRKPRRTPGDHYTRDSYRKAIHRACDLAGVPRWSPNRLRHSAATDIRQKFGLEAAQVTLGHASADITQVYAERNMALARKVAAEVG
jgi:integrase